MYLSPTDKVTKDEFNHCNCLTALNLILLLPLTPELS